MLGCSLLMRETQLILFEVGVIHEFLSFTSSTFQQPSDVTTTSIMTRSKPNCFNHLHQLTRKLRLAEVDAWTHTAATMKAVHSDFCKKFGLSISESSATDACSSLINFSVCIPTSLLTDLPVNQVVFIMGIAVKVILL